VPEITGSDYRVITVTNTAATTDVTVAKVVTTRGAHGETSTNKPAALRLRNVGGGDNTGQAVFARLFSGDTAVVGATTANAVWVVAPGQTVEVALDGVSDADMLDGTDYEVSISAITASGTAFLIAEFVYD
jgi:hypothetical protein